MRIAAFQNAIHHGMPGAPRRRPRVRMQDALAIHRPGAVACIAQHDSHQWPAHHGAGDAVWLSVADGVSASPHARLASRSFLHVLHGNEINLSSAPHGFHPHHLPARVRQARRDWQGRFLRSETAGASTTLASLLVQGNRLCAVNCGDSRIWRLRPAADGAIHWLQMSRDHTVWQQMLDDGEVQPAQRATMASIYQGLLHCLTLGEPEAGDGAWCEAAEADAPPEEWLHTRHAIAQPGDSYLLATDGLHETIGEDCLRALWRAASLDENIDALRRAYLERGATDDCSVVAVTIDYPKKVNR